MRVFLRLVSAVLIIFAVLLAVGSLSSQGPRPSPWIVCQSINAKQPERAVFIELLVKKEALKSWYVEFDTTSGNKFGIAPDSEIALLTMNGYVSYTFHFQNAISDMELQAKNDSVSRNMFKTTSDVENDTELFEHFDMIRFAYLSKNGDVLSVTNECKAKSNMPLFKRNICQVVGNQLTISFHYVPNNQANLLLFFLAIMSIVVMLFQRKAFGIAVKKR